VQVRSPGTACVTDEGRPGTVTGRGAHAADLASRAAVSLETACALLNVDGRDARLVRAYSNAVFHLPHARAVARIMPSLAALPRVESALRVTRWLTRIGFAVPELFEGVEQPLIVGEHIVTLWRYLPQEGDAPTVQVLGLLLRHLHDLPPPPFPLPEHVPLDRFREALVRSTILPPGDIEFLDRRAGELVDAYGRLDYPLPRGLVHGDARVGNLLRAGDRVVLGDWDSVSIGPRELDLVVTLQAERFGMPEAERLEFSAAYGVDIVAWSGFEVLRDIRELHTLTAFLRMARDDPAARRELTCRVESLQTGDRSRRWTAF
jgi:aminoglycoside phosphotransferase (APT) family kinase protein